MYRPLLQLEPEPVAAVPPEPPSQVPELALAGARAVSAIADAAAAVTIPALMRVRVKPVSFVGRRG
ncbi:MAG: hypothetical protein E6G49_12970 [Actinobacteria bacterium]|nr:MAG: hypothetical protein E6G49_12970 [Actinomycetota bacterium]